MLFKQTVPLLYKHVMSPAKIPLADTMEEFDWPDESKMDRMMLPLNTLLHRLEKIETERIVGLPDQQHPLEWRAYFWTKQPRPWFDNVIPC